MTAAVVTLPGAGDGIAVDLISGARYQFAKLTDGAINSTVSARVKADNPDSSDAGLVVRQAPEDIWSVSFTRASASGINAPGMIQRRQGTGVTVTQSGGNLLVGGGTTANSEFLARSERTFNGAMIQRHQLIASQRIANNNFVAMLADRVGEGLSCTINSATSISVTLTAHGFTAENVGQSMFVGAINGANGVPGRYAIASIPNANTINFTVAGWPASGSCTVDLFGWNYVRWLYTGTTATNAGVDAQRFGYNSGDTTATINTSASPGHMAQTLLDGRNIYFQDGLIASATAPALNNRGHRWVNIPDQDVELHLYLWSFNGTTNPASNTTWTIGFIAIEDTVNVPVYLAGIRPQGGASAISVVGTFWQATQPVSLATNTPILAAGTNRSGFIASSGIWYDDTITPLAGAATFIGTSRDATVTATATAWANAATYGSEVRVSSESDVVGDLWVEFSRDNATWRRMKFQTAAQIFGGGFVAEIVFKPSWRYWRVGYTNGGGAQARFTLGSIAMAE
jgi:hypothetical protein